MKTGLPRRRRRPPPRSRRRDCPGGLRGSSWRRVCRIELDEDRHAARLNESNPAAGVCAKLRSYAVDQHASRCFTVHAAGHGQSADCAIRQRPEQAVGTSGPVPIARSRLLPSVALESLVRSGSIPTSTTANARGDECRVCPWLRRRVTTHRCWILTANASPVTMALPQACSATHAIRRLLRSLSPRSRRPLVREEHSVWS